MGFFDKILGLGQKTDTKTVVMQKVASDVINETINDIKQSSTQSMQSKQKVNAGGRFEFINSDVDGLDIEWNIKQTNVQGLRMTIAQALSNTTDTEQKAELSADIQNKLDQAAQLFAAQCAEVDSEISQDYAFSVATSVVNDIKQEMNQSLINDQEIDASVDLKATNSKLKNVNLNWNVEQVNDQFAEMEAQNSVSNTNRTKQSGSGDASAKTNSTQTKKFSLGEFLGDGLFGGIKNILLYGIIGIVVIVIAIVVISMVGSKKSDNMQQAMMQMGAQATMQRGMQMGPQGSMQMGPQGAMQMGAQAAMYAPPTQPGFQAPSMGPQGAMQMAPQGSMQMGAQAAMYAPPTQPGFQAPSMGPQGAMQMGPQAPVYGYGKGMDILRKIAQAPADLIDRLFSKTSL